MQKEINRKLRLWKRQLHFYRAHIISSIPFIAIAFIVLLLIIRKLGSISEPPQLITEDSDFSERFPDGPLSKERPPNPHNVSVWYQARCRGIFHSQPAKHSDIQFPYAIIRDATVDRRPVTRTVLRGCPKTSSRFTLYLSVHSSVELSKHDITTSILNPNVSLRVHYVLHATKFLLPAGGFEHAQRTRFGHVATEWHVGMCLSPSVTAVQDGASRSIKRTHFIREAVENDSRFNMTMTLHQYDGEKIPVFFNLSLACVQGWATPGIYHKPKCTTKTASRVKGAAIYSGSALYGDKKKSRSYFREIAHFAIRALSGPLRYDAVIMSVVSDSTITDASYRCGNSEDCFEGLRNENNQLLDRIGDEIQTELNFLGAPKTMAKKVILISSCVLGSDAWNSEMNDACNQTKHYGQYWATVFAYAPLAPYFKWATSNDMDEFFMPETKGPKEIVSQPADGVLDAANAHTEGNPREGSFVAQWLNFLIDTEDDSRSLSTTLVSGRVPQLTNRIDPSKSSGCYDQLEDDTGKSAVRCDVGYGFTVHSSIFVFRDERGKVNFTLGWRVNRDLRTWHARYFYSKGNCMYKLPRVSPNPVLPNDNAINNH